MAMTIQEALKKVNASLLKKIDDALTNEVFAEVQDEEAATIYEEVYKVYKPRMYRRRGEYEGLGDAENIVIKGGSAKGGVLTVINVTEPNPGGCLDEDRVTTGKDLPQVVETGQGYDFPRQGRGYVKPRPFTKKTIERLKESKAHVKALKGGLKRNGVKAE